jgi:predicted nuclease of predicted toxin-antitoxin system
MNGFLIDENLPNHLTVGAGRLVLHVRDLGLSLSDSEVWDHARANDLVIVSKDADFSYRIMASEPHEWCMYA